MAHQQLQIIADQSTYTNYFNWASAISDWFATCGWIQSADTGQVMWSGLSISAVSMSGSNMTCTYSGLTGLALAVGRVLTITGWAGGNTGNNGTFVITALGSGTFTAVNASGVNVASSGTGIVTQASTVPSSSSYYYEFWQPNDGLTNFYVKMEYGNAGGSNTPGIRITISASTNGTGTATGILIGPTAISGGTSSPSSSVPFECNFHGGVAGVGTGRIAVMMWRNTTTQSINQFFAIERSINSSGAYTGSYVTVWYCGPSGSGQETLLFGLGPAPAFSSTWAVRVFQQGSSTPAAFNGSIPMDLCSPLVGYFDFSCTVVGSASAGDITEGVPFQNSVYGATNSYMPSKNRSFAAGGSSNTNCVLCMRFD